MQGFIKNHPALFAPPGVPATGAFSPAVKRPDEVFKPARTASHDDQNEKTVQKHQPSKDFVHYYLRVSDPLENKEQLRILAWPFLKVKTQNPAFAGWLLNPKF